MANENRYTWLCTCDTWYLDKCIELSDKFSNNWSQHWFSTKSFPKSLMTPFIDAYMRLPTPNKLLGEWNPVRCLINPWRANLCEETYKYIYIILRRWDGTGRWTLSPWEAKECLSHVDDAMTVDAMTMQWCISRHGIGSYLQRKQLEWSAVITWSITTLYYTVKPVFCKDCARQMMKFKCF